MLDILLQLNHINFPLDTVIIEVFTEIMDTLILSNVLDYQSFFNTIFETYLIEHHVSGVTRKNYRSDLRNFFNWLVNTMQNNNEPIPTIFKSLVAKIKSADLEEYKRSLLLLHTPEATINRRLSSLRVFFRFTEDQGWLTENPMTFIRNVVLSEPREVLPEKVLHDFREALTGEGASETTIKNYVADVGEFLAWLSDQNSRFYENSA